MFRVCVVQNKMGDDTNNSGYTLMIKYYTVTFEQTIYPGACYILQMKKCCTVDIFSCQVPGEDWTAFKLHRVPPSKYNTPYMQLSRTNDFKKHPAIQEDHSSQMAISPANTNESDWSCATLLKLSDSNFDSHPKKCDTENQQIGLSIL